MTIKAGTLGGASGTPPQGSMMSSLSSRHSASTHSSASKHTRRGSSTTRPAQNPPSPVVASSASGNKLSSPGRFPDTLGTPSAGRRRASTTESALMEVMPVAFAMSPPRSVVIKSRPIASQGADDLHTHRTSFIQKARMRSRARRHQLPESFRPWRNVFDQSSILPRPWRQNDLPIGVAFWCRDNSVPPEHAEVYKKTEDSVKEAIKTVTMVTVEVAVKIIQTGVLEYVPIPGLSGLANGLVKLWKIVQGISNNRLRLLRLTQRCAHLLMSIKRDVEAAGDRINASLQNALFSLQSAFERVMSLAESQIETPFLQRLINASHIDAEFASCDEDLTSALRMFSLSVQISTMKLVLDTTDGLRQQNEDLLLQNQQLYALYNPTQLQRRTSAPSHQLLEPSPRRLSTSESRSNSPLTEVQRSASLSHGSSVSRPTASSRNKQVAPKGISESYSSSGSPRRQSHSKTSSTGSNRMRSLSHEPQEDPIEKIRQHQRIQNDLDRQSDVNDMKQIIRETLAEAKESVIVKLLQIDRKDYPQAITVLEHELREYRAGKREVPEEDKELQEDLLQRGVDAMKRMTNEEDMVFSDWSINKFRIFELETIGYGSFSTVRRGVWNGKMVAIKILSPKTKRSVFENEMRIWKHLSHPNILPLYGSSNTTEEPLFFVSLYAKHGNLVDFLRAIRQNDLEGVFGGMLKERDARATAGSAKKRISLGVSPGGMREQAHHNRWQAEKISITVEGESSDTRLGTLPLSQSDSKFHHCHILKEGDLYGFMSDIATGMDYLHENGVLHGDLKASNVLVNDDLTCIISDFGQSERRNDIYRASGWTPKGTARWKAPELLTGSEVGLTTAVDVYAFAITCIEILSMGNLPWGSAEDVSLAHRIVVENLRPPVPQDFRHPRLVQLLERWWHKDPGVRPDFKTIATSIQALVQGTEGGALEDVRRRISYGTASIQSESELASLESHSPHAADNAAFAGPSSPPNNITPETIRSYLPGWVASDFSDLHLSPKSMQAARMAEGSPLMPTPMLPETQKGVWEPIVDPQYSSANALANAADGMPTSLPHNYASSFRPALVNPLNTDSRIEPFEGDPSGFVKVNIEDANAPSTVMKFVKEAESMYRHVRHDFHWSLRVPLWNPVLVEVGDVGYINAQTQTFVTLFNAFEPCYSPSNSEVAIPSIMGFGDPLKKTLKIPTQKSRKLFRTFAYKIELEAGKPAAHCFCESPDWHYMENTRSPQAWFKASVDTIMEVHADGHGLAREDLMLVVGSLQAARYSLFVSQNHPNGTIEFTGHSGISAKRTKLWGAFGAISVHGGGTCMEEYVTDNRVSDATASSKALFLAALHFPTSSTEPCLK